MLKDGILNDLLEEGKTLGADLVEVFVEHTRGEKLTLLDSHLKEATGGIDFGVGIRLIQGKEASYAYTNDDSPAGLRHTLKSAAAGLSSPISCATRTVSAIVPPALATARLHSKKSLTSVPIADKLDLLHRADVAARATGSEIKQVSAGYLEQIQKILIVNSEGLRKEETRERCRFVVTAIASSAAENQTGTESPGARRGWEFFNTLDVADLGQRAARRARIMLSAASAPSGTMPVIIDKGFGGVIFHEACGHALETHNITRHASVFEGRLGTPIAASIVSAVDDGTLDYEWGSIAIDDEGTPAQRTQLIENGILKNYMSDRLGALELDLPPTGSGRRESYRYAPVSRMRNTFILPGSTSLADMIANTAYGLYAKHMGGGSVNPATGEFNFAVTEGYLIKNGRIDRPVRGAVLIGKGQDILMNIDMVGTELGLAQGMCGAASGWVPVDVGQPALRVNRLVVGGIS